MIVKNKKKEFNRFLKQKSMNVELAKWGIYPIVFMFYLPTYITNIEVIHLGSLQYNSLQIKYRLF